MEHNKILLSGDTPGISWAVPVFHFAGSDPAAPKTYLQGALHADELPAPAVLHFLCQKLRQAENENRIVGDITIVPQANPIGLAQMPNRLLQGRYDVTTGTNFNRDFQLIAHQDRETLLTDIQSQTPTNQLKNNLLYLALGADIVIDLHCDLEAVLYTYLCEEFWPDATDFASTMDLHSVFISDGQSSAFEEAVAHAFRKDNNPNPPRRFVTTLELRGQLDVSETFAEQDAAGLFNFLAGRGVVKTNTPQPTEWNGIAVPLDNIELVCTPVAGTVLLQNVLGDVVKKGDLVAKVISQPGSETGIVEVTAPQDGIIVSRMCTRFAPRDGQLYKMLCQKPSTTKRPPGALES